MKKVLCFILCACMVLAITAAEPITSSFEYENLNTTIVFEDECQLTQDQRQYIADMLAYNITDSDGASTYAWCWLLGHDITSDYVTKIQHKLDSVAPRCYQTTYKVDTCSNCDFTETTEVNSTWIDCCPAD